MLARHMWLCGVGCLRSRVSVKHVCKWWCELRSKMFFLASGPKPMEWFCATSNTLQWVLLCFTIMSGNNSVEIQKTCGTTFYECTKAWIWLRNILSLYGCESVNVEEETTEFSIPVFFFFVEYKGNLEANNWQKKIKKLSKLSIHKVKTAQ